MRRDITDKHQGRSESALRVCELLAVGREIKREQFLGVVFEQLMRWPTAKREEFQVGGLRVNENKCAAIRRPTPVSVADRSVIKDLDRRAAGHRQDHDPALLRLRIFIRICEQLSIG